MIFVNQPLVTLEIAIKDTHIHACFTRNMEDVHLMTIANTSILILKNNFKNENEMEINILKEKINKNKNETDFKN